MKLFDKQSLALLVSVVTINVLCIIAVSYAYFTTQIKGNDTAGPITVVMGSMKIKYEDSDLVTLDNAIPGDYLINKFRITNTGTLDATYNLKIDVVENNFRDKGDLEYTLRRNNEVVDSGVLPYVDGYIQTNITIPSEEIHNYELEVKFKVDEEDKNQNDNKNRKVDFKIVVDSNENAEEYVYKPLYKDNSGANIPELYQGLIPIYYNESNQIVIADVTEEWYNYDEHEWANAVLIDHTNKDIVNKFYNEDGTLKAGDIVTTDDILQMYVWIPRYKYQLFNAVVGETAPEQMINIAFEIGEDNTGTVSCEYINQHNGTIEEKCTNAENGEWYTHPAFTFGDTELGGIWIGKFETTGTVENVTIKPDLRPIFDVTANTMFESSRNIEKNYADKYGVNQNELDTHMMKNIEWGAMAYLTQSKYGRFTVEDGGIISPSPIDAEIWINNNSNYLTGCGGDSANAPINSDCNPWTSTNGMHTSTTDNQYGIYGVSGGGVDRVMTTMVDEKGNIVLGNYGFDIIPSPKYYDIYSYNTDLNNINIMHLGDAARETSLLNNTRWYGEYNEVIRFSSPWMHRGGNSGDKIRAGLFYIWADDGTPVFQRTFRVVLTVQDGID